MGNRALVGEGVGTDERGPRGARPSVGTAIAVKHQVVGQGRIQVRHREHERAVGGVDIGDGAPRRDGAAEELTRVGAGHRIAAIPCVTAAVVGATGHPQMDPRSGAGLEVDELTLARQAGSAVGRGETCHTGCELAVGPGQIVVGGKERVRMSVRTHVRLDIADLALGTHIDTGTCPLVANIAAGAADAVVAGRLVEVVNTLARLGITQVVGADVAVVTVGRPGTRRRRAPVLLEQERGHGVPFGVAVARSQSVIPRRDHRESTIGGGHIDPARHVAQLGIVTRAQGHRRLGVDGDARCAVVGIGVGPRERHAGEAGVGIRAAAAIGGQGDGVGLGWIEPVKMHDIPPGRSIQLMHAPQIDPIAEEIAAVGRAGDLAAVGLRIVAAHDLTAHGDGQVVTGVEISEDAGDGPVIVGGGMGCVAGVGSKRGEIVERSPLSVAELGVCGGSRHDRHDDREQKRSEAMVPPSGRRRAGADLHRDFSAQHSSSPSPKRPLGRQNPTTPLM